MIGTSALNAAFAFVQIPSSLALPAELDPTRIEVTVETSEKHFCAANESHLSQVLLFGRDDEQAFMSLRLSPGGSAHYALPWGAAEDLWFEVVALDGDRWRNTGALSLGEVERSLAGTLWVQEAGHASLAWIAVEAGIEHMVATSTLCSTAFVRAHGLESFAATTHVPLPMPAPDVRDGPPPVLDKKPLPPF